MIDPCGACGPCKAGKSRFCAHTLLLDSKERARLTKLLRIVGERPQHASLFVRRETADTMVREKPEPTSDVLCVGCGGKFQMMTFLYEFAQYYKTHPLRCEPCRSGRQTSFGSLPIPSPRGAGDRPASGYDRRDDEDGE